MTRHIDFSKSYKILNDLQGIDCNVPAISFDQILNERKKLLSDKDIVTMFYTHLLGEDYISSLDEYYVKSKLIQTKTEIVKTTGLPFENNSIDEIVAINKNLVCDELSKKHSRYEFLSDLEPEDFYQHLKEEVFTGIMVESGCIDNSGQIPDFKKCAELDVEQSFTDWIDENTHYDLVSRGYSLRDGTYYVDDWWNMDILRTPIASGEYENTRRRVVMGSVLKTIDLGMDEGLTSGSLRNYVTKGFVLDEDLVLNNKEKIEYIKFDSSEKLVIEKVYN